MKPAKVQILGNYWDSQIYRGKLYLFTYEGSIKTVDWTKLIESLKTNEYTNIALTYGFLNGRNLYHSELHDLFKDEEIRNLLRSKFEVIAEKTFIITEKELNSFLIKEQSSPFNELQVDSEIFSNRIYVLSHNSLLSSAINTKNKLPVNPKIQKHSDLYAFSMRANRYAKIAISAGDDGLMEYNGSSTDNYTLHDDRRMQVVSSRPSSFADYSFISLYSSSLQGQSFLSYYKWEERIKGKKPKTQKEEDYDEQAIFKTNKKSGLSWGSREKLYRVVENGLEMVRFNNYAKPNEPIFSEPKFLPFQSWKGNILSAYIAYFGTVLLCENAVVIMQSDGSSYNIYEEATRVRIFPRSLNYENHLHVILDNRVEIYSFNNDYFVDQKEKNYGFAYQAPKTYGFVRGGYATMYENEEDFYKIISSDTNKNGDKSIIDTEDLPF